MEAIDAHDALDLEALPAAVWHIKGWQDCGHTKPWGTLVVAAENLDDLFRGCLRLWSARVSVHGVSRTKNMRNLFGSCYALEKVYTSRRTNPKRAESRRKDDR